MWIQVEWRDFSIPQDGQAGSGAQPAFCSMGIEGSFHGGKAAGAWPSPSSSTKFKNEISVASSRLYSFMARAETCLPLL